MSISSNSQQPTAFTRAQKLLALIPGLQYPSPEAELLESLGAEHLDKLIDAVSKKQSYWDLRHGHTSVDLEWFGKFLSALTAAPHNHDDFTLRSIVLLGAVVAPAMTCFIPAYEANTGNEADLPLMIADLNHKLMTYWDCYPEDDDYIIQELHLEHEQRWGYAIGAFIFALVDDREELPLSVADDIHLTMIGMQCHMFGGDEPAKQLFSDGELLHNFFNMFAESKAIEFYNSEMEDDFPTLSFSLPDARGWQSQSEDAGEDVWSIGGASFDRSCVVLLDRVARNEGLEDASCLSAFKLAQLMCDGHVMISRPLLTMLAEWEESRVAVLLELATGLTEEQRGTALITLEATAKTPRDFTSEENLWRCLHALRTAALMTDIKSFMNLTKDSSIIGPVSYSCPDAWQDDYKGKLELGARGALLKFVIEDHGDAMPSEADWETCVWMGEYANELLPHAKTLREHGLFDRGLMESILTTNTLGGGVL